VPGTHWEYIADACNIWSWFVLHLAVEFFRWSLSLCLACVGLSDDHSDQHLLIIRFSLQKYVDVSILVNKTVHRNSSLLFTINFTEAAKLSNSSFVILFQLRIILFQKIVHKCKIIFTLKISKQIEGYIIQIRIWFRLRLSMWTLRVLTCHKFWGSLWKEEHDENHFQHQVCCDSTVKSRFYA
jgi:hypothetical protein